ncbi:hypothetical protein [Amycolatopsis sp. cmx-8-4]|uniref:hypothetical protein n=1 Tax=Amycolatopsis sp. cmx-8-4 TaxID=2790947 RepID=UPI00397C5BE2
MADQSVHLKLSGRISFEEDISLGEATKIVAFIDALHSGGNPDVSLDNNGEQGKGVASSGGRPSRNESLTPREAIDVAGAKTNGEKIVALAANLLNSRDGDTFEIDEIGPLFQSARERVPAKINRDLSGAIASGWVAEAGKSGEYFLTKRVENILESGFAALRARRTGGAVKPRATAAKKTRITSVPENFEGVDICGVPMPDIPSYGAIKVKRDRLLWATRLAKELGLEGLSNKEIVWLTDKLGDGIVTNDVNGNFKGLQKLGYINRSTINNLVRITAKGEEYLKAMPINGK